MANQTRGVSTVTLYKINKDELNSYKNLSQYESHKITANVQIVSPFNELAPTIKINKDIKDFNYMLLLGKYYTVDTRVAQENGIWILGLTQDVLQTWLGRVSIVGIVSDSSSKYNADIHQELPLVSNKAWERKAFTKIKDDNLLGSTFIVATPFSVQLPPPT